MAHVRVLADPLAVRLNRSAGRLLRFLLVAAEMVRAHHRAGGQALEVPLPRPRQRFVEVVDPKDEVPFRGGEHSEVRYMRVATGLHEEAGGRSGREIARHHGGRAAEEGEGGGEHARVADRHQLGKTALALLLEDGNGIAPPWRRRVLTVTAAGHLGAQSLARRHSLGYGESRVRSTASGYEGLGHSTHRTLCRPGPHVASHRFLQGPSASRITTRTSPGLPAPEPRARRARRA